MLSQDHKSHKTTLSNIKSMSIYDETRKQTWANTTVYTRIKYSFYAKP